eukprot:CAMPEP_0184481670 /NCGR_PEP_ID=MMETSP0113_2-20130426/3225_1 /TAXON_ID=91329 /ORGANISM="Norrisiella sphaerica, Strain BC52" /LENGTH=350 /DNA_ID=CAMNT_0026860927 /DNA_START=218 /DNA_END=1270 /DNA_ORIENTATION=+
MAYVPSMALKQEKGLDEVAKTPKLQTKRRHSGSNQRYLSTKRNRGRRKKTPSKPSSANVHPTILSSASARRIAKSFCFDFRRFVKREVLFSCDEKTKAEYESSRRSFSKQNLTLYGFHLIENFVEAKEEEKLMGFIRGIKDWKRREKVNDGGEQMTYGVEFSQPGYKIKKRTHIPGILNDFGLKAMRRALEIETLGTYSCHSFDGSDDATAAAAAADDADSEGLGRNPPTSTARNHSPPTIDQIFLQKYTKRQSLGFHFDNRSEFGEIICGVSLGSDSMLLLGATNGSPHASTSAAARPTVQAIRVPKNSLYVFTGMSRYDLRHAVVHDEEATRYSFTFRSIASHRAIQQ